MCELLSVINSNEIVMGKIQFVSQNRFN